MLPDLLQLCALRRDGNAVAFQIDVDALRAVRRALSRRLAARTERAAAFDARSCEAVLPALQENQRCDDRREHAADRDRIARADERIERRVVAEESPRRAAAGDPARDIPRLGDRRA